MDEGMKATSPGLATRRIVSARIRLRGYPIPSERQGGGCPRHELRRVVAVDPLDHIL